MADTPDLDLLMEDAQALLGQRHSSSLGANASISLSAQTGPDGLRIILALRDGLADTSAEFTVEFPGRTDAEAIHLALDFLDGVLVEHLESGRRAMPRLHPAPVVFEGHTLHLSGQLRRPDLEAQADALLAGTSTEDDEPA